MTEETISNYDHSIQIDPVTYPRFDPLMTAREVSQYLRVHYDTVIRWTKKKRIPVVGLVAGSPRYRKSSIDAWLSKTKKEEGSHA